jgi:hypothetical protein
MKRSGITPRQPVKQDMRRPIDTQSTGLRGGAYSGPSIKKDRTAMVPNFDPGIKGGKPKTRKQWWR